MSFNFAIPPALPTIVREELTAQVESHRKHGANQPTMRVLDSVSLLVGALGDIYPEREIMVEQFAGHFGDPDKTSDEGYFTLKVKVKPEE